MMLSDVCHVHPVGGRRVRPADWIARIGWSAPVWPAWLKAAAARFPCRPGWEHIVAVARLQLDLHELMNSELGLRLLAIKLEWTVCSVGKKLKQSERWLCRDDWECLMMTMMKLGVMWVRRWGSVHELATGSFHVNSTNLLELSSMTTSEFDEIFKTWSLDIHKKACKISGWYLH